MPRKPDKDRIEEARRLYASGLDVMEVAARLKASDRSVRTWVADIARPAGRPKRDDVRDDLILDLKDREGLSFEEIGRRVHMSKTGARMRYYAVTGRRRPERRPRPDRDDG